MPNDSNPAIYKKMDSKALFEQILAKKSFLCVGLDSDRKKLPAAVAGEDDPVFAFNRAVVDATAPYAVAYKPNLAFYEADEEQGWRSFQRTVDYIRKNYPEMLIIADAKRGDIGNTSKLYARAFFESAGVDAVTLSPYMGRDTVDPFLAFEGKWAVLLALTSNASASDFETERMAGGEALYEMVLRKSQAWGTTDNLMYVVGATQAEMLTRVRAVVPDHFLLVPGVGAQGGSLQDVAKYGMNKRCGLLVNSSRGIIFADPSERFARTAGEKAAEMQREMASLLDRYL